MMRYLNAHEPALTPQEAAMLTAMPASGGIRRTNLLMPRDEQHFVSTDTPVQAAVIAPRQGSVAGRAVLHAAGISLPGVQGMSRGCRRHQDRQQAVPTCFAVVWL